MIILPTMRAILSGFSPLSLSPATWHDSDASTYYDSTTGGSAVAADGTVARWEDKSGNGRHHTQASSTKRPVYKSAIVNGRPVLLFDGVDDFMITPAFAGSETWTRFLVLANLSQSQYKVFSAWATDYTNPNPGADYMAFNSGKLEWVQNGSGNTTKLSSYTSSAANSANGTFLILSQSCDGTHTGNILLRNGSAPAASAGYANNPGTFSKTATALAIGAQNTGVLPANCYVAESIQFSGTLTAGQQSQVRNYLGAKYGVAVS